MFERCEKWWPLVGDHGWPDCDMLPLGHLGIRSVDGNWPHPWENGADRFTRFTKDEQKTMMTLWTIFRSPMFFGGELRDNDEWTLNLLTDPLLTEMHRTIIKSYPVKDKSGLVIWNAEGENTKYTAKFNLSDGEINSVPPHGVELVKIK
jgi:hypothetical protein